MYGNNPYGQAPMTPPVQQNPMNNVYGIFGGAQNFQQQASLLQQRIPVGVTPEQYANQLLQSGQITQDRLNWAMNIANQFYGR